MKSTCTKDTIEESNLGANASCVEKDTLEEANVGANVSCVENTIKNELFEMKTSTCEIENVNTIDNNSEESKNNENVNAIHSDSTMFVQSIFISNVPIYRLEPAAIETHTTSLQLPPNELKENKNANMDENLTLFENQEKENIADTKEKYISHLLQTIYLFIYK